MFNFESSNFKRSISKFIFSLNLLYIICERFVQSDNIAVP